MQETAGTTAFQQVISIERLVDSARGVKTPCLYYELKHMAINKDSDWRPVVNILTERDMLDRIQWCEAFIGDILILRQLADALEQRMTRVADLKAPVGSQEHIEGKLRLLLARGENAVLQSDVCEDVLLRALRRMLTLTEWGYTVSPFPISFTICHPLDCAPTPHVRSCCRAACAFIKTLRTGE